MPLKGPRMGWSTALLTHGWPLKGYILCLGTLAARKRVDEFFKADLIRYFILF